MRSLVVFLLTGSWVFGADPVLEAARDKQDRAALEKLGAAKMQAATQNPKSATAQYEAALAQSYLSEVALELKEKKLARIAAENGIAAAKSALSLEPSKAEYHRVLGTLCGQVIPADPLAGFKHGQCAKEEIEKALKMDPKSALAWVSSGVGKYYLPPMLGGSVEAALKDFQKASALDPKLEEAWLWIGLANRKSNHNSEARQALQKALALRPGRIWIQQQLEKTPAQ